jgi:hypothetical protein
VGAAGGPSVFFYCAPAGPPERANYQHAIVCIAEGLRELGLPFVGDRDYWRLRPEAPEHLIQHRAEIARDDCDVVVVTDSWFDAGHELPGDLFHAGRRYTTVYIDAADGAHTKTWTRPMRAFDVVLRAQFNDRIPPPAGVQPWAYGLSSRIIEQTEDGPPTAARNGRLLFTFRLPAPTRDAARRGLAGLESVLPRDERIEPLGEYPQSPYDRLMWEQTGRRHNPAYYARLKESTASAAFCGWVVGALPLPKLRRLPLGKRRIVNWDSWRLWESLAAGCATFHVDLDLYGIRLPLQPKNWLHYVGVDLRRPHETVERIIEEPEIVGGIGEAGRAWALEHYAPRPTAERFLALVGAA